MIKSAFDDSSATTPVVIIVSSGGDPIISVLELAKTASDSEPNSISMGQGQPPKFMQMFKQSTAEGKWLIMQNCQFCMSFMPQLERLIFDLALRPIRTSASGVGDGEGRVGGASALPPLHPSFRLWMTSEPSPKFAISVLYLSAKVTSENTGGAIALNMKRALMSVYSMPELSDPAVFVSVARLEPLVHIV
eukprot:326637-Prymnesium_polylepis.2